jgi:glucose/arabinose dehydrogenase
MRTLNLPIAVAASAALALAVAGCTVTPTPSTASTSNPVATVSLDGTPTDITTGLDAPWSIAFLNTTPLVSERDTGRILELADDGTAREVGIIDGVVHAGEGGLLGVAVDDEARLFVYSTGQNGNRIERYDLAGGPGSFALGSRNVLVDGIPSASYHDGGRIAFGPDGMLYATAGDAGRRDDAQNPDSLAGKILCMTPDGEAPDDNPFPGSLVYSYGHRNPQGIAWTTDGTMFATEFGQNTWDELNIITPGGNYGWPTVEGIAGNGEFIDPVQQWTTDEASPSGMVAVDGALFIANLRGRVLRAVPVADPTTSTDYYTDGYGRIRDVTLAPDGTLWFLTNNTDGRGDPGAGDDRILSVPLGR